MNLSKSTISLRKQEMTECSNESTDYNLTVYRYVMHVFCVVFSLIRFLLAFLKCIGKQLLSDLHKSFAISIRILLRRRTFMIIFFPRGLGEPPKCIQFLSFYQARRQNELWYRHDKEDFSKFKSCPTLKVYVRFRTSTQTSDFSPFHLSTQSLLRYCILQSE